jgi:LemA protein
VTGAMEITAGIVAGLIVWGITIYNKLIRDRNRVLAAWSDIDVQLKRRHDLIPKLVETVKQYAAYERATVTAITELRSRSEQLQNVSDIGAVEAQIGSRLSALIAIAEDYPDLKANQSFLDLQENLTDVENHLQYARRYYNGAVRNLNIRIDSFPDIIVAGLFGFKAAQFFQYDAGTGLRATG